MKRILALFATFCLLCPICGLAEETVSLEDLLLKGAQYAGSGDYESAEICYDIALKLSPDDPTILSAMADMYFEQQDYAQALSCAEGAVALAPADGALYLLEARILFAMERIDDAEMAMRYGEICGAHPDDALNLAAAVAYAETGRNEQAVAAFEQLPESLWRENHADLYRQALLRSGNADRAQDLGLTGDFSKNPELAAAMESGIPLSFALIAEDVSEYPVYLSRWFYEDNLDEANAAGVTGEMSPDGTLVKVSDCVADLYAGDVQPLTASPSGEITMYRAGSNLLVSRNGQMMVFLPNYDRCAGDEEAAAKTLERYYSFGMMLEQDGVAWSPDERYFALTFPYRGLMMAQFMDLIIGDVRTGDLFVVETTPDSFSQPGAQTACFALFDGKSENVYYTVYGDVAEGSRYGLKRYNLESGSVELLWEGGDISIERPRLCMDGAGNLRCVTGGTHDDMNCGVLELALKDGQWASVASSFSNPLRIQYPMRYQYSALSGFELILNRPRQAGEAMNYITLSADLLPEYSHDFAVMLPGTGGEAELTPVDDDFIQIHYGNILSSEEGTSEQHLSPWMDVIAAELSPDGFYALIFARDISKAGFYLLDLTTLRFSPVALPDGVDLSGLSDIALGWFEDNRIICSTATEGSAIFKLNIG